MTTYPIIANCNFSSRDDEQGKAIHAARQAVEAGLTDDAGLIDALGDLEDTLAEYAESDSVTAVQDCRYHEAAVLTAWNVVREQIEAERNVRPARDK
jgi:ClpP class serine protease